MHALWQQCLESSGAKFSESDSSAVQHFGDRHAETRTALDGDVIADLGQYALLRVSGEDAREFMHNQVTTDLRSIGPEESRICGWCNPKGRLLAQFRLSLRDESFLLRLPSALLEPVRQRLGMFVLRSRVRLEYAGEELVMAGLSGPDAPQLLEARLGDVPDAPDTADRAGAVTIIRVPGSQPRFELIASPQEMAPLWQELAPHCRPVGQPAWELLEVLAGLPEIYPQTREAFVPQMANLHWLHGVDFRKGCYPGQEVVARMYYLGKLKRRMYLAQAQTQTLPKPGTPVQQAGASQAAGTVVRAAWHPQGGTMLLAVLKVDAAESGGLALEDGAALTLRDLPYATPEREATSA